MLNLFSGNKEFENFDRMVRAQKTAALPDYIKIYSVFQYDRNKFKELLRRERAEKLPQTLDELYSLQKEILKKCYILDDCRQKIRLADEPHIFRYPVLYRIYSKIYELLNVNSFDECEIQEINGLRIFKTRYTDENYEYRGQNCKGQKFLVYGAEIIGSEKLSIKDRVKVHIKLLRLLRAGHEVKNVKKNDNSL